jgi:hypothetical protein
VLFQLPCYEIRTSAEIASHWKVSFLKTLIRDLYSASGAPKCIPLSSNSEPPTAYASSRMFGSERAKWSAEKVL